VEDTLNNTTPQTTLGSCNVAISTATAGVLAVTPAGNLISSGTVGGPFSPASIIYTLTNSGGTTLNWTASKTANWVSLSATSGSLAAGAATTVTVSLNSAANSLAAGSYNDTVSFANTTTCNGNTSRGVSLTVNSPGQLAVTPAGNLIASGTVGGPFSPGSILYTLTNSGGTTLNWTASKAQNWVSLSATSGSLAAGAATTVTVSLNANANSLTAGNYNDTVSFANTTTGSGNTSRGVSLAVNSAGQLAVTPAGDLISSGTVGGSFSPASIIYTLTNSGGTTLNWTASKAQNWVSLSATSGSLAAGAATTVTVSLNANADSLAAGNYSDTVSFANTTTGNGNTSRSISLDVNSTDTFQLTVAVNDATWGSVSPTNGTYLAGASLELLATPAAYYQFGSWTGDLSAPTNPITIVLNSNLTLQANFAEVYTTNHPTPHWWLAQYGFTNDLENAVTQIGANGFALWQSYIAGLNPNDPNSQLRLSLEISAAASEQILRWSTVSGRVYSVWFSTNLLESFAPLTGATDLPWTIQSVTNAADVASPGTFYRLEVWKP